MKRLFFVFLLLLFAVSTACAGFWDDAQKLVIEGQQIKEQVTPDQPPPAAEPRHEAPSGNDDQHYIQADDYFVSHQPLGKHSWIYVTLAKMTTAPTAATKGEGEFFKIKDGNNIWTKHFWRTRIARPDEIRLGAVMIMFEGNRQGDVYRAPTAKDDARRDAWFMAKITDTSDLYKGYITVSGGYKVSPTTLRVLLGN